MSSSYPSFPTESSTFLLPGAVGDLELMTTWPSDLKRPAVVIICHPHPLFQGSMKNKVVTTLFRAFDQAGMATVRFNFRGVGKSEGEYAEAVGEQDDLEAVLAWVSQTLIDFDVYLAGFSFGSYVAAAVANREPVAGLITVAPPVHHFAFSNLNRVRCPWLLVMGEEDEIVPMQPVQDFVAASRVPIEMVTFPEATHFFHGQLLVLREQVMTWLSANSQST